PFPQVKQQCLLLRWLPRSSVVAKAQALCAVLPATADAERPRRHSHAEREERSKRWFFIGLLLLGADLALRGGF
ncbi:hypothetical protein QYS36_07865, partial [Pseudomonas sp. G34]|nr:hypothetical protein [Pseudomonas sp. G34]